MRERFDRRDVDQCGTPSARVKKGVISAGVRALLLALATASASAGAAAPTYSLEPFTSQQFTINGSVPLPPIAARFLTLLLADAVGQGAMIYEHVLPSREEPVPPLALKAQPRFLFEGHIARRQPFESSVQRILLYWGCGERAGEGQPRVIQVDGFDDEQVTRSLAPSPDPFASGAGAKRVSDAEQHVAFYDADIPRHAAMRGPHELRSGGARLRFTVNEQGEFLPAVAIDEVRVSPRGYVTIRWQRSTRAAAYFVNMFVQRTGSQDVVVWTSSRRPEAGYLLAQAHPGGNELTRLRLSGVLMDEHAQECTVPSAVTRHTPHAFAIQVHAFGQETLISAAAGGPGLPATTVRITPRATTTVLRLDPDAPESGDPQHAALAPVAPRE